MPLVEHREGRQQEEHHEPVAEDDEAAEGAKALNRGDRRGGRSEERAGGRERGDKSGRTRVEDDLCEGGGEPLGGKVAEEGREKGSVASRKCGSMLHAPP